MSVLAKLSDTILTSLEDYNAITKRLEYIATGKTITGKPKYKRDAEGNIMTDEDGEPITQYNERIALDANKMLLDEYHKMINYNLKKEETMLKSTGRANLITMTDEELEQLVNTTPSTNSNPPINDNNN